MGDEKNIALFGYINTRRVYEVSFLINLSHASRRTDEYIPIGFYRFKYVYI